MAKKKTATKEDLARKLNQEKSELSVLLNKGIEFEVEDVRFEVEHRLFGLIKKRVPVKYKRTFKIGELTLGTLDRLSAEWVEFEINEQEMATDDRMKVAKSLAYNHSLRCAKIIALAVLDSDYLIPVHSGGFVKYKEDVEKLKELTDLFARTIKPSELFYLISIINLMSNLGDFTNSIRLMEVARTTTPDRIEENSQG
ncbi:hypothetical protein DSECCO2_197770 [anaerobic digester metagenome]